MIRTRVRLALLASILAVVPLIPPVTATARPPVGAGLSDRPPSFYGYPLDDWAAGYFGGGRYREYYAYGRGGYGLGLMPGPVPWYPDPNPAGAYRPIRPLHPPPPPLETPLPLAAVPPQHPLALPITVAVQVPADALVWFDGTQTTQTGAAREFFSPPVALGRTYTYEVRAKWKGPDGREVDQTQTVAVEAGQRAIVQFPVAVP
jgi:uncharacterized protein (TIGR03000 family)